MLQRTIRSVPGLWASPACLDVSVVIVSYNTREVLRDCLRSLFREVGQVEFEVIVVDNCSADRSAEMVADEFPQAVLIENVENLGFAAGCNRGMVIARGRYILLLNPDTVVLDRAIEKTVAYADSHPEAAVVGCQVLCSDGSIQGTCFRYPSLLNIALSSFGLDRVPFGRRLLGRERMKEWGRDSEREVDVVTGCYMLVRRESIEGIGLMDEQYFVYAEEADWCYRFARAGWKVVFAPVAQIIHITRGSTSQVPSAMLVQLEKSLLLFLEKHRGRASRACARVLFVISGIWHFIAWWCVGIVDRVCGKDARRSAARGAAYAAVIRYHLTGLEPKR